MKKKYEPPQLNVVTFQVEKGYAGSIGSPQNLLFMLLCNADGGEATTYSNEDWTWDF